MCVCVFECVCVCVCVYIYKKRRIKHSKKYIHSPLAHQVNQLHNCETEPQMYTGRAVVNTILELTINHLNIYMLNSYVFSNQCLTRAEIDTKSISSTVSPV